MPTTKIKKGSDYMKAQIEEMLSSLNRYYTGIALGRSPSSDEAATHYVENGGPEDFEKRWFLTHPPRQCEDAGS